MLFENILKVILLMFLISTNCASSNNEDNLKEGNVTSNKQLSDMPTSSQLIYNPNDAIKIFNDGLKSASNKLGLITNRGIPDMLLSTINSLTNFPKNSMNAGVLQGSTIFSGFFRLLGFDTDKLQAIALNAIVFIAQMIGSNLIKGNYKKDEIKKDISDADEEKDFTKSELKNGTPLQWILQNAPDEVKTMIIDAQQSNLAEKLIQTMQGITTTQSPHEGYCLQQLICRLTPVIKGMQENTKQLINNNGNKSGIPKRLKVMQERWLKMSPSERMYAFMPNNDEFIKQKQFCEEVLPRCEIR